ncbi:hypothetical protein DYB25_003151 [Aphanomyces astaci]|uniref:BAG domain-containing protein n=1 Tax=Aphanomyces astaci TaxID=112090 RepID=A0A397E3Q5_APHAT|nr:hypothetical protein DYB25_003151 [Aphanomyces astaci]RHY40661.1 hypothetical protein DYB30_001378 [Aphanomyces astaci]RHY52752.1 hypothetical protein DYB34_004330 [Aphanomyces astaci]RHY75099.1 hypothetical protein DYB38_000321 [Aphanomyces astaci]RHZ01779.1 hypothetical protein DYB31_000658 [Aphanomyces astaci]
MESSTTSPNKALSQLQSVAKRASDIEEVLVRRLPNQRKLVAATAAAKKWLACSVWKEDNDRIELGLRQAKLSLKQYCHRVLVQAEDLTKLLFDIDLILSEGDPTIRQERKAVVKKIQELLLMADTMSIESDSLTHFVHSCTRTTRHNKAPVAVSEDDTTTETSSVGDDFELVEMVDDCATSSQGNVETESFPGQEHVDDLMSNGNDDEQVESPVDNMSTSEPVANHDTSTTKPSLPSIAPDTQEASSILPTVTAPSVATADASPEKPHTIHVHVNGHTYVTQVQGDTTHIYINERHEPSMVPCCPKVAQSNCIPQTQMCSQVPVLEVPMLLRRASFVRPALVREQPVLVSSTLNPLGRFLW